jgi:glyoxylase-like metal-dependent hydrolase (beta-lactamase superfamily II)
MAAGVLVLANVTAPSGDLIDAIKQRAAKGPIDVTLLMPGHGPGLSGREAVRGRLDAALAAWREAGIEAEGICGDANPLDALAETWDPRRHDEVIVSTLPGQSSRWIAGDLPARVGKFTGAPVTHVVANDMRPEPHAGPPPEHETSPLGPLGVLGWAGARK